MIPPHTKAIPQKRSLCVPQAQGDLLFPEYGIVNKQKAPGALCVSGAFFAPQADEGPRLHSDRPRSGQHTYSLFTITRFTFHSAARGRHFSALCFSTPYAANVQNSGSPKGGRERHCAKKEKHRNARRHEMRPHRKRRIEKRFPASGNSGRMDACRSRPRRGMGNLCSPFSMGGRKTGVSGAWA